MHGFSSDVLLWNCERADELAVVAGSAQQELQTAYALVHVYTTRADPERAPTMEQRLEDLARTLDRPEHRLLADSVLLRAAVLFGDFERARRLMHRGLVSAGPRTSSHGAAHFGADPIMAARSLYALALWFLGDVDRAKAAAAASLTVAEETATPPFTRCSAMTLACLLRTLMRDPVEALRQGEEAERLARDRGFDLWSGVASGLVGWARVHTGEVERGIEQIRQAVAALEEMDMTIFSSQLLAYLAEAHLMRTGDWRAGLEVIERGLRIAETTLDRMYWPELWRLKAELLLAATSPAASGATRRPRLADVSASSGPSDARGCVQRALEIARQRGARSLELRAATTWLRMSRREGAGDGAAAELARLCDLFGVDEANPDLVEARALLSACSAGS